MNAHSMPLYVVEGPPREERRGDLYCDAEGRAIGPFHPDLIAGWRAAGVGGKCPRCGDEIVEFWGGLECPTCEREYQAANGCRCGGDNLCPDCMAAGATEKTRGEVKCQPGCSTLCPVCSPDD